MLIPTITFEEIEPCEANRCLVAWGHKMGALARGNQRGLHHALMHNHEPVAVVCTSHLIHGWVGGGLRHMTRENTRELSRLCAVRPGLCRVAIRLWREFVFPDLGVTYAISYQDADLHNGATYRFDGWRRECYIRGTPDLRSGRPARNKWVWVWERPAPASNTAISRPAETQGNAADSQGSA